MLTRNRAVFKPTGPKTTGPKPTGPKTTGPKKLAAQPGLADTLGRPRYEVLPLSGAEAQVTEHVPADATVTVTASVDRKSTRLNSSHVAISYAVFCLKKKKYHH